MDLQQHNWVDEISSEVNIGGYDLELRRVIEDLVVEEEIKDVDVEEILDNVIVSGMEADDKVVAQEEN